MVSAGETFLEYRTRKLRFHKSWDQPSSPGFEQLEVKQTDDSYLHMAAVIELLASFTKKDPDCNRRFWKRRINSRWRN